MTDIYGRTNQSLQDEVELLKQKTSNQSTSGSTTNFNGNVTINGLDINSVSLVYALQGVLNDYNAANSLRVVPLSSVIDGSASTNFTAGTEFQEFNPSLRNGTNTITLNETGWFTIKLAYSHPDAPILGPQNQAILGKDGRLFINFNGDSTIIPFGAEESDNSANKSCIVSADKYLQSGTTITFFWIFEKSGANQDFFINVSIIKIA